MSEARHPIRLVSRRTGVTQDLLRAWEKRYGAVTPHRSATGRRLYSDADIARLTLLKKAVDAGRRISDVVGLPLAALRELVNEDRDADAAAHRAARKDSRVQQGRAGSQEVSEVLAQCLQAVADLDRRRLDDLLTQASVNFSRPSLRIELFSPLLHEIGEKWRDGNMRVAHEHMASALIRSHLATLRDSDSPAGSLPLLIVTTPPGQLHEFGALMAAATAVENGWEVVYLGPNLPAEEIAAAARQRGADAVALSIIYPSGDPRLRREMHRLRQFLGPDIPILVGGRAAAAYRETLSEIRAVHLADLDALHEQLERFAG